MSADKAVRFTLTSDAQPSLAKRRSFPRVPTPHPRDFARHLLARDREEEEEEEGDGEMGRSGMCRQ